MKFIFLSICVCLLVSILAHAEPIKFERHSYAEPTETWGYVDVRQSAHMFYWLYYTTNSAGFKNTPLVMWLQGGPGGSGTGFGNFEEIGPLDDDLKPRNTTWLQSASLLFVDNPVGTGFSYVDHQSALTTNVSQIAIDMVVLLKTIFNNKLAEFQDVPFYIFSESYGGKMAAVISRYLYKAVQDGEIKVNFKGFAMGDSWIVPETSTIQWAPYCYGTSLVDMTGYFRIYNSTAKLLDLIAAGRWRDATDQWGAIQGVVSAVTNGVNFYNILKWGGSEPSSLMKDKDDMTRRMLGPLHEDKLTKLMNTVIRKKLKVIPDSVTWGGQSGEVFNAQGEEFMKPVAEIVDELIQSTNLKVVVYSGQLDLIVETTGTEEWVYKLQIAEAFKKATRRPILHPVTQVTSAFVKTADNFSFYWILDAGHMIPSDQGDVALEMLKMVIKP